MSLLIFVTYVLDTCSARPLGPIGLPCASRTGAVAQELAFLRQLALLFCPGPAMLGCGTTGKTQMRPPFGGQPEASRYAGGVITVGP